MCAPDDITAIHPYLVWAMVVCLVPLFMRMCWWLPDWVGKWLAVLDSWRTRK